MCGLFGVIGTPQAAEEIFLGLQNLQHRGQDGAGIVIADEKGLHEHHGMGLLDIAFPEDQFKQLTGALGIGHTRYGTFGGQHLHHLQPFSNRALGLSVAHNGNLVNYPALAQKIAESTTTTQGQLKTSCDSEYFRWVLTEGLSGKTTITPEDLLAVLKTIADEAVGSYSVIGFIQSLGLFAFRDPWGLRPLEMGQQFDEETQTLSYAFASESTALRFLNYAEMPAVEPGQLVVVTLDGTVHRFNFAAAHPRHCMFEWVYFARVESTLEDLSVYKARFNLGVALAQTIRESLDELPDVVVPIPETSRIAAIALAEALNIPFREVLIKNRYVNRTFILDSQAARRKAIGRKLYPVAEAIEGKRVLLVDDSIVRGNTSVRIAEMLRQCGAKAIYLSSTCPPIKQPCFYGIDFPCKEELVAGNTGLDQIHQALGVDKVIYQTMDGLKQALNQKPLCTACLDGDYPTDVSAAKAFSNVRSQQRNDHPTPALTS